MTGKKTILDFNRMKETGEKWLHLAVFDYYTAMVAEQAGVDQLLVGDSVGMTVYGLDSTVPVTLEQVISHCQAVRRGAPNSFVVGDMPFLSYQVSPEQAVTNAGRLLKETGVDAVKMEGGRRMLPQVKACVDAGMLVLGHVGMTPQSAATFGGFKPQGTTSEGAIQLLADALALQDAGACIVAAEAVPPEVGKLLTERLRVPVLGGGAGPDCDGQALVSNNVLGLTTLYPKFSKRYVNLEEPMAAAFRQVLADVKEGRFPTDKQSYEMRPGEARRLAEAVAKMDLK